MIIISGSNGNKYNADVNHKNYAKQHNIEYHYFTDIDYKQGVMQHPGYLKTYAIRQALESHDRVMWIDDDAFFIDFNWDCRTVFDQYTKPWIVSQSHPVKVRQAILNSGIMFYRKNLEIINMLSEIPNITDKEKLNSWQEEWGTTKGNDQPRYILMSQTKYKDCVDIVPYNQNGWNKRRELCMRSHQQIVHFAGTNKESRMRDFERRVKIDLNHSEITYNIKKNKYTSR